MRPRKKPYTWRRASEDWISRTLKWDEREGGRGAPKDGIGVNAQRAAHKRFGFAPHHAVQGCAPRREFRAVKLL